MKTSAEAKDLNYKAEKRYGSMNRTIDTSYTLPDSFRTVDNTEVETLDLVLDANGDIVDSPVINNSSVTDIGKTKLNTGTEINNELPNSYNTYKVGSKTNTEALANSESSSSNVVENEILDMPIENTSKAGKDGKDMGSFVGNRNNTLLSNDRDSKEESMAIKTEKLNASPSASSTTTGVHPQINVDSIEFEGGLMPTNDNGSSGDSDSSSSSSEEAVSSSHRQTESLAYYSNDWVSIFDAYADIGYNSVLDTNYFNNAYASTAAKLSKNAKYVR